MDTTASQHHRRVLVIGNLTIDDVVLADGTMRMGCPGGNTAYAALAARLWNPHVGIVTRRGEDLPPQILNTLTGAGIDTAGVRPVSGPTIRNWVIYEEDGRRRWLHRTPPTRPQEVAVQPGDIPAAWLDGDPAPVVHVAAMPLAAAAAIVQHVRKQAPGALITVDTHEDWGTDRERVIALARLASVFVPSREELADLAGYDDPPRACAELHDRGVPVVVVKLGSDGALIHAADQPARHISAYPADVADTTGAGDTFCGALAAALGMGLPLPDAVQRAAASAAWAIEDFGSLTLARLSPAAAAERFAPPTGRLSRTRAEDTAYEIDVMRREIAMIPAVVAAHTADAGGHVRRVADALASRGIENLFVVGCGDSYFAGLATALAFRRHTGVHAQGVHALDFARYQVRYLPPHSAVICVSFSGKVGRTIEAAVQASRFGALTVALTGNADGELARAAGTLLPVDVPTLGFSPGTSTYLGMVATLTDLALRWGKARGCDVGVARAALGAVPELAGQTLAACADPAEKAARSLAGEPWITFLGGGPNEASAKFGAAKLFEGPQLLGVSTSLEEWAHEEYFVSSAGTPVVMVAPSGASADRAAEILREIDFIAGRPIVISDRTPCVGAQHLPLAPGLAEEFSPLLAALPLSLIGFHLAELLGKKSYNFPSEAAKLEHYDTIHRLVIGEPA
jgi:sugar/nucleoside kinase (ribokinase family)/fructoselysine-6-P-deglycase FrlB-like protein